MNDLLHKLILADNHYSNIAKGVEMLATEVAPVVRRETSK